MVVTELLPSDYEATLTALKKRVHAARFRAQRAANTEMVVLYWEIGQTILERQQDQGWGSKIIDRLAADLRSEFPSMQGFSPTNLKYMRRFAATWPNAAAIGQRPVDQLPWGHVIELMTKVDDQGLRDWYAAKDAHHQWSRQVLTHQIKGKLHEREAAAPSNFTAALDSPDSELAQQLTKDPYTLDFLAIDSDASERELESRLTERVVQTLFELGPGFSFVARQKHFDVDGDDFYIDLLFFHVEQLRYVVIELKTTKFEPKDAGQLGFYVALVDDRVRRPEIHSPTVGILLVADKNETVVRYALAGTPQPVAVSRYELSPAEQAALPAEETLARLADEIVDEVE